MLGKTPSRYELLSMVRKHSMSLGRGKAEAEEEASEMDAGFWCDIFDLYFLQGKESRGRQDDDLLFFVKKFGARSYGINDSSSGGSPYFVRRLQKAWFQEFCRQVDKDCEFLEQERIMDYSFLVGLHFRDVSSNGALVPCGHKAHNGYFPSSHKLGSIVSIIGGLA